MVAALLLAALAGGIWFSNRPASSESAGPAAAGAGSDPAVPRALAAVGLAIESDEGPGPFPIDGRRPAQPAGGGRARRRQRTPRRPDQLVEQRPADRRRRLRWPGDRRRSRTDPGNGRAGPAGCGGYRPRWAVAGFRSRVRCEPARGAGDRAGGHAAADRGPGGARRPWRMAGAEDLDRTGAGGTDPRGAGTLDQRKGLGAAADGDQGGDGHRGGRSRLPVLRQRRALGRRPRLGRGLRGPVPDGRPVVPGLLGLLGLPASGSTVRARNASGSMFPTSGWSAAGSIPPTGRPAPAPSTGRRPGR